MAMYATPSELAGYMQQTDLDAYTATQALTLASMAFSTAADTMFEATAVTYTTTGTRATNIVLPYKPIISVSAVRINSVAVTGYTLIGRRLFRIAGFGSYFTTVPDLLEVDLTHGYTTVPDDVKRAVLESAASTYTNPTTNIASESIDDYKVEYAGTAARLSAYAQQLAALYRGRWVA